MFELTPPDPRPTRLRHRFARRAAVVGAGLFLVGACSSTAESGSPSPSAAPGAAPTTASTTTTTAAPAPTFPLTGMPLTDPAQGQKPALVIKIDNVDQYSRPQAGINQADIVYEEKIEGPISRFAAVFHSTELDLVGPIRSGRSTDVAIVSTVASRCDRTIIASRAARTSMASSAIEPSLRPMLRIQVSTPVSRV